MNVTEQCAQVRCRNNAVTTPLIVINAKNLTV